MKIVSQPMISEKTHSMPSHPAVMANSMLRRHVLVKGNDNMVRNIVAKAALFFLFFIMSTPVWAGISISKTVTNVVCYGASTGSITVNAGGGHAPYTYLWSNGSTATTLSGLAAGTYSVTATDNTSATGSLTVTITQPASAVTATISNTNVACNGASTGSVTLTPSGGTTPYTYAWSNAATTQNLTSQPAGTYNVTVTDKNLCTYVTGATITQPTALTKSTSPHGACGGTTGSITLTVSGATSPYTYLWSNAATTKDITGILPGTYTVTITDANSCTTSTSSTVNSTALTLVSASSSVSCPSGTDGRVDLAVTTGTSSYTYLWSTGATTASLSNVGMGTYTVTVTDAQNCTASKSTTVSLVGVLGLVFYPEQDITGSNGSIKAVVYGGTAPFTYAWSTGATTDSIYGISAGTYTLTVTDANGNTVSSSSSITSLNDIPKGAFIVDMGVTPQTIANGLKPYGMVYDLARNYNVPIKWVINTSKTKDGTDFTYNGYDYKGGPFIIDTAYRTAAVNARIAYWQTQGVVGTTTTSAITVPVYNVITGFSNLIIDQANESLVIPYFTNAGIPSSIYQVGLPSDLNSCDDVYALPHADPTWAAHSFLKTFNQVNHGSIWVGCHAVSVLEGISDPSDTSNRMNFLTTKGLQCYSNGKCGGLISEFHAKNETSPCSYTSSATKDPIMQFMGDMVPATQNGSEEWYIPLSNSSWNSGTTRAVTTSDGSSGKEGVKIAYGPGFNNSSNGMVMYEAGHSAGGAEAEQVAFERAFFNFILYAGIQKRLTISQNIPTSYVVGVPTNISVSVTSGTAPYTYAWSTNANATFSSATSASTNFTLNSTALVGYSITCIVTDACGRRSFVTVPVTSFTKPHTRLVASYTVHNPCHNASNGSINANVTGGTLPYHYVWSTGATTQTLSNISAGTYSVTVSDSIGCDTALVNIVVSNPAALTSSASATDASCYGGATGTATVTPSGGASPYTYIWSNSATTATASALVAGSYTATVTDANSCTVSASTTVSQPAAALAASLTGTNATCNGLSNGGVSLAVSGGTSPYTYLWSNSATSQNISSVAAGTYTVTVTDAHACTATSSKAVTQPGAITPSFTTINATCHGQTNGSSSVSVTGGTSPYSYAWSTGSSTNGISNKAGGTYTVTITDNNGCTASSSTTITEPAALSVSVSKTNNSAAGVSDGTISTTPSGGTSPYTYAWSNSATAQNLTGLAAGYYTVTVTDNHSCTTTSTQLIRNTTGPCTCIATGVWTNPTTWSGNCSGGGGLYAGYLDDIVIQGYRVTVDSLHTVKSLILRESSVDTTMLLFTGSNQLEVLDSLQLNTVSSGKDIKVSIDGSASLVVDHNLTVNHSYGNNINMYMNALNGSAAKLWVKGDLNLNLNSGGNNILLQTSGSADTVLVEGNINMVNNNSTATKTLKMVVNSSGRVIALNDLNFRPVRNGNTELDMNGTSTLEMRGNINRPEAPSMFGKMVFATGATLLMNGSSQQALAGNIGSGGDNSTFTNITLNSGSQSFPQFVMNGSVTLSKSLRLVNGDIKTNADSLILSAGATIDTFSASSYVIGNLTEYLSGNGTYSFPVGRGGTSGYFPAFVNNKGLVGVTYLTAKFGPVMHADSLTSIAVQSTDFTVTQVNRTGMWTIEPNQQPLLGQYDMTLGLTNFKGLVDYGFVPIKRPHGGEPSQWGQGGGLIPALGSLGRKLSDGVTSLKSLSSFSDFGVGGNNGGGLPITLLAFHAIPDNGEVSLDWQTEQEINNDFFTVQRSLDGVEFEDVLTQKGAGNSSEPRSYNAIDPSPYLGISYYRLKQTDFDGHYSYSALVPVTFFNSNATQEDINVYPNPNDGIFSIDYDAVDKTPYNIMIFNSSGNLVYMAKASGSTGRVKAKIELNKSLPAGTYLVKMESGNGSIIKKIIVER